MGFQFLLLNKLKHAIVCPGNDEESTHFPPNVPHCYDGRRTIQQPVSVPSFGSWGTGLLATNELHPE